MATYETLSLTIPELFKGFVDKGEEGVFAYNGKLIVRPAYQREFVYDDKKRKAVISSIMETCPISVFYWALNDDGTYEVIDGQQRIISICQFMRGEFSVKDKNGNDVYYHNLTEEVKANFDNYPFIDIKVMSGTAEEKLAWFEKINIAGEVLTKQELRNASYTGEWLSNAKSIFSKNNCPAKNMSDGFLKGTAIRQEILETALEWISDKEGLKDVTEYMSKHQHDNDANELWVYFQNVINWARTLFDKTPKITDCQEWGILYNKYKDKNYNTNSLKNRLKELLSDDDVSKKSGIIPYLLSNEMEEKYLSIRAFTDSQKLIAYTNQNGICPICGEHFEYEEMQGDHILPWSRGGHTTTDNLQMLCVKCNKEKSAN